MADRNVDIKSDGSGGFVLHPDPVGGNSNQPLIFPGNWITWHNQSGQTCCVLNFDPAVMDPAALTILDGDKGKSKVISLPGSPVGYSVISGPCTAAALRVQVGAGTGGIIIVDPPPVDDDDDDKSKGKPKGGAAKRKVKSKSKAKSKPKSKSTGKARPKAKSKTKAKAKAKGKAKPKARGKTRRGKKH